MSYFLRGALLSSAVFFLVYAILSSVLVMVWPLLKRHVGAFSATWLFGLRVLPVALALFASLVFVIPSFIYLEPNGAAEMVGYAGIVLACGGMFVVVFGAFSALLASWKTSRFVRSHSKAVLRSPDYQLPSSAIQVEAAKPILLVAGVLRPTLVISRSAIQLLKEDEMRVAIRHELAHVISRDNLKKLVLQCVRFPFLVSLERSWMRAAEIAADEAVATDPSSAVDLASALVKMATPSRSSAAPKLAMSLASDAQEVLCTRVERLLNWQAPANATEYTSVSMFWMFFGLVALAVMCGPLWTCTHELTELFIR